MVGFMTKNTLTQDNFDPWTSLGLATAMVLNRLHNAAQLVHFNEQQKEPADKDGQPGNKDKQDDPQSRADIERRIRDILAMENRLRRKRI
jgi:hypothetical protein